jgi:hypothetical protein
MIARRFAYRHALKTWGTKSFEFWTALMATLQTIRPEAIVELGSGRSSSYLAEYAQKTGAEFVSIEQNRHFARRIRLGMMFSFLDNSYIHMVGLAQDGWYKQETLSSIVPSHIDFLFIDGPVGWQESLGCGTRSNARARQWMKKHLPECKGVIIDDVHRRSNLMLVHELFQGTGLKPLFFQYSPQRGLNNTLVLAVHNRYYQQLVSIFSTLNIKFLKAFRIEDCCQD